MVRIGEAHAKSSLPGAIGMYGLSLGVQHLNDVLPAPVYALLTGLNASSVGIIALAAVQLADKAIRDKLTRILVIFGACAGLCYNALWYFPLLLAIGGFATVVWDGWMSQKIRRLRVSLRRRRHNGTIAAEEHGVNEGVVLEERSDERHDIVQRRGAPTGSIQSNTAENLLQNLPDSVTPQIPATDNNKDHAIRVRVGIAIVVVFFGESHTWFYVVSLRLILLKRRL